MTTTIETNASEANADTTKPAAKRARLTYSNLNFSNYVTGRACSDQKGWGTFRGKLSKKDVAELMGIFAKGCRAYTQERILWAFNNPRSIRNYGIFERIYKEPRHGWSYCAGQDYRSEIATIRKLLVG